MAAFFNTNSVTTNQTNRFTTKTNSLLDSSIITKLQSVGYIITAVNLNAEYVYKNFTSVQKVIDGGFTVPGFQDSNGVIYIIDEKGTTYVINDPIVKNPPVINNPNPSVVINPGLNNPNPNPPIIITDPSPVNPTPPIVIPDVVNPNTGIKGILGSGNIYSTFNTDDIVPNQQELITHALWSGNIGNLTTFYTSSLQSPIQKRYFYEIYNKSTLEECDSEPQFSIAYGNIYGSGSIDEGVQIEDTPSRAIYSQYKLLCLNSNQTGFTFNGELTPHIYAINVNRARMREFLDEGNIEINLAKLNFESFLGDPNTYTGSNVQLKGDGSHLRLIDDSRINPATIMQSGEVYNIVSGSLEDGVYYDNNNPIIYGQLFRRLGIIILDATKLDSEAYFGTVTGREIDGDNSMKLFTSMQGASNFTDGSGDTLGFQGRGGEKVKSTHYFVRVKNGEYNFSNNPSFVTGTEGDILHPTMFNDPRVYITTIGLYNNSKELIAVAKLNKAIEKSFSSEALIKIRLDF